MQYPPPQWQQPPLYPSPVPPQKWYMKNAGVIALLILFFPVGLYLMWKYVRWPRGVKWIITAILVLGVLIDGVANAASSTQPASQASVSTQQQSAGSPQTPLPAAATATTIPTPTSQLIQYPPKTLADLHGLAAKGDVSAIYPFHSESVGLTGVCPQPKREVTVDPGVTGKRLAEDLLAYFYSEQLDSPCGSVVFAYHNQGEANDVYTAGRISFDVTDSSGAENTDPNATNLTHTLTLDIGGLSTGQEYVVTY